MTVDHMTPENLREYDIDYLYHMTHINNLASIIRFGLLSHNAARRLNVIQSDISDPDVQSIRASLKDKIYNRSLHEYVPLYFSPRNPMLYRRKEMQEDIVILGIDPNLLFESKIVISDGNAAAGDTAFYGSTDSLHKLKWEIVRAKFWNNLEDGKRVKCAEVLVPNSITADKILRVFCYSSKHRETIIVAKQGTPIKGLIKPEMYFNPDLYF